MNFAIAALFLCQSAAPADPSSRLETEIRELASRVASVTLYPGRAAVTRIASIEIGPGLFEFRFSDLPSSLDGYLPQAKVVGSGLKILGVTLKTETVAVAADPKIRELEKKLEALRKSIKLRQEDREEIDKQLALLESIKVRASGDLNKDAGTERLDPEKSAKLLEFVRETRKKLIEEKRGLADAIDALQLEETLLQAERSKIAGPSNKTRRVAVVQCAAAQSFQGEIELKYLVRDCSWAPAYQLRVDAAANQSSLEYDAVLTQRTGEDWDGVDLKLSTAQPMLAANPPALTPLFLSLFTPRPHRKSAKERDGNGVYYGASDSNAPAAAEAEMMLGLALLAEDASVISSGPAVQYKIPRKVTVKSDSQEEQKTRIATLSLSPELRHIAVPAFGESVYLRGEMANSSEYQLLAGNAQIFFGEDFVGPTSLPAVAPGEKFRVHFGIDPSVTAEKKLVKKFEESKGLFGGDTAVQYDYKIELNNHTGRMVRVELLDRIPVSQIEKVEVELQGPSLPLDNEKRYLEEERKQGILRWTISLGADRKGEKALAIDYSISVRSEKGVTVANLP